MEIKCGDIILPTTEKHYRYCLKEAYYLGEKSLEAENKKLKEERDFWKKKFEQLVEDFKIF